MTGINYCIQRLGSITLLFYCVFIMVGLVAGCASTPGSDSLEAGCRAYASGEYQDSLKHFEKSLEHSRKIRYHPAIVWNLRNIGDTYSAMGDIDKALEYYDKSLRHDDTYNVGLGDELKKKRDDLLYTIPCKLKILEASFSDRYGIIPNGNLDAGEEGNIICNVANYGKGKAYNVRLSVMADSKNIEVLRIPDVVDIPSSTSHRFKIPIKGKMNLQSGTVKYTLVAGDERGYFNSLTIVRSTSGLNKPQVTMSVVGIKDSESSVTSGNGNGLIENREVVEIELELQTGGNGDVLDAKLYFLCKTKGISIQEPKRNLGAIKSGKSLKILLLASASTDFSEESLGIQWTVSDSRNFTAGQGTITMKTGRAVPVLHYRTSILDKHGYRVDKGHNNVIENGEQGLLNVVVCNEGNAIGRSITIRVGSDTVSFMKKESRLTRLDPHEESGTFEFPFLIPRTLGHAAAEVRVHIDQDTYPGADGIINIPHRPFAP